MVPRWRGPRERLAARSWVWASHAHCLLILRDASSLGGGGRKWSFLSGRLMSVWWKPEVGNVVLVLNFSCSSQSHSFSPKKIKKPLGFILSERHHPELISKSSLNISQILYRDCSSCRAVRIGFALPFSSLLRPLTSFLPLCPRWLRSVPDGPLAHLGASPLLLTPVQCTFFINRIDSEPSSGPTCHPSAGFLRNCMRRRLSLALTGPEHFPASGLGALDILSAKEAAPSTPF